MNGWAYIIFLVNLSLVCQKQIHSHSFGEKWEGGVLYEQNGVESWPIRSAEDEEKKRELFRTKADSSSRERALLMQRGSSALCSLVCGSLL